MSNKKACCPEAECFCDYFKGFLKSVKHAKPKPKPPPVQEQEEVHPISDSELAEFAAVWEKQLQKDRIANIERTGVDLRPVGPCQKQEVAKDEPPAKRRKNNLVEGRKEVAHDTRKGKKQIDKHGSEAAIQRDCVNNRKNAKCGCGDKCWNLIHPTITAKYRKMLFSPGSTRKQRFEWAHTQVADFYMKARDRHNREGKSGEFVLKYYLTSPVTGE